MAQEDVAKLLIVVGTKGAKEAATDLEKVKKGSKGLGDQTKKTDSLNQSFGKTMNNVRAALAPTAAAVYLVKGAYNAITGAVAALTEAYEEQYSAEIKLQTILQSTNYAIGYTYDQIYAMAQAWEDTTGINDSVILQASAIAATFTQISQEVFPDMIEQALNMSTIFGQDLKQSIIQLGKKLALFISNNRLSTTLIAGNSCKVA